MEKELVWKHRGPVVQLIAAGAIALAGVAVAEAQDVVTSPPRAVSPASAGAYWTAARKAAARPMPAPRIAGRPVPVAGPELDAARVPGSVAGNTPGGQVRVPAALTQAQEVAPTFGAGSTVWYDYPPPSSIYMPVLDYIVLPRYPHTALGKLFFSVGSSSFVCSAQSVTSAGSWGPGNRQTVITAGHCCSESNTFFSNWAFEPAHFDGAAPFGTWTAQSATVFTDWFEDEDLSRDLCVLQMNTRNSQNINDAVGALGYAFNQPLPLHYHATGWPAASPFNGGQLIISTASDAETDTSQAGALAFTHGIGNSMTGGSSGGAWLLGYQPLVAAPGKNLFNGVNSYKYVFPDRPAEMFGPYVDDAVIDVLLREVATSPPAP